MEATDLVIGGEADRLGPLTPNRPTTMGLDCLPVRCSAVGHAHDYADGTKNGQTHLDDAPCPFEADGFPKGIFASCCWLRGKAAARELEAFEKDGLVELAECMHSDLTHDEAIAFAEELEHAACALELKHGDKKRKPHGAGWNGEWDAKKEDWVWQEHSTFEEAVASIREAARWYAKVGALGFGVHAWY